MTHRVRDAVSAVAVALALTGCQTTGFDGSSGFGGMTTETASLPADTGPERISWDLYTPLYDQADHLKDLLTVEKDIDKAATLYLEQKAFFQTAKDKYRPLLDQLKAALNDPKTADLKAAEAKVAAITWPAPAARWESVKVALGEAEAAASDYPSRAILSEPDFRAPEADRLAESLKQLTARIEGSAEDEFAVFDHFGTGSFFDRYPVEVNRWMFLIDNFAALEPTLLAASTGQLKSLVANYPKDLFQEAQWNKLGGYFVAASLREAGAGKSGDLIAVLGAVNAAKEAGFEPKQVPGLKMAFIEVTSKTLLEQGQIDFPATVDVDMPIKSVKAELDEALTNPIAQGANFLIVFDVALAKASRRVLNLAPVPSILVAGHKTIPNPDYNIVQNEVNNARLQVNEAAMNAASTNAQYCYGMGCLGKMIGQIAAGAAQQEAQEGLQAAMAKLSATPQLIEEPIHKEYKFDKATIVARKAMTVHYYVIDRAKKTYFKSTFDVNEEEKFEVAYRISDKDTRLNDRLQAYDTEKEVDEFEKDPSSVKLSQLIDHYLGNKGKAKKLASLESLRKEMLTDKNTALANFKANTFDSRPLNDPRFDSVVAVYTGKGSLGSGFFVKPDIVLTNWHVVDEFKYVEMKTYDGQETFGKVLGKDVRLDLALIKVQSRGKPVRFYIKNKIDLGATTDAIGHPEGHEFSITRGIVSAIRKHYSISLPRGAGDDVLYVQTDTPINHGNSGGPLFLGDRVIGVNTWGEPAKTADNIGFAVHHSEVLDFLKEHLPGFMVLK